MNANLGHWLLSPLIAVLVAVSEISSRYRDQPLKAVLSWPAVLYGVLNASAAVVALFIMTVYGGDFSIIPPSRTTPTLCSGSALFSPGPGLARYFARRFSPSV